MTERTQIGTFRYWWSIFRVSCKKMTQNAAPLILLCAVSALANAQSSPTELPAVSSTQALSNGPHSGGDAPSDDQRGTPATPLVVEIHPTEADAELARENRADREQSQKNEAQLAQFTAQLVQATVVLAVATILLFAVTAGLFFMARQQSKDMKESIRLTSQSASAAEKAAVAASLGADAADRTVKKMDETAQRELRAYISVEPAGIHQMIASTDALGHVKVRNVGRIPAHNVAVTVHMTGLVSKSEDTFPADSDAGDSIKRTIHPGAAMSQGSKDVVDVASVTNSKDHYIFVWGTVFYDAGFGQRRFSRFCHRYPAVSYNRDEDWNKLARTTRSLIASDKARYHATNNDAD